MKDEPNYRQELRSYLIGFVLALVLTAVPFGLVATGALAPLQTLGVITVFALIQVVVHFRFFLHIDLSQQKREDLHLILFTVLLLLIMCTGMIWIMASLSERMH
ncbi:cytochrome o ubiquinol oxidase subunit IV [Pseudoruegeria sp. SK021]|uniref:cytochrome o ubiquinol oxidase subunit IV n=1 Tax=Pseudoruegeria sp. SK021 TaxID=1933035 RepID=UPI000A218474|nr:cytochrome o ubiquinol oxidase subunit IV [Pseudoruegeria sp. SK021]OSP56289.1 cytochrome o ubiquinol oxidase subunit IV [Pseudoruegeria sp. SK021]